MGGGKLFTDDLALAKQQVQQAVGQHFNQHTAQQRYVKRKRTPADPSAFTKVRHGLVT